MGLFYTPNPPHLGAQQPLEGKKLTPPSAPASSNPPLGSAVHNAILGCWAAVAVAAAVLPNLPRNLTPPSAPVIARIVPNTALQNILVAWTPPALMPIVADNLTPPSAPTGTVTLDAAGSLQQLTASQASPVSYTGITVAGNALVACLNFCGNAPPSALPGGTGSLTLIWDQGGTNQTMTQIGTVTDSVNSSVLYYYALLNPTPGNKTLQVSWSNGLSSQYNLAAISFNNVDQSSLANAFPHFTTNSGSSTAPAINVTSAVNHMALAMTTGGPAGTLSAPNHTELFTTSNTTDDCGVQYANGTSTVSFTWVLSSSTAWSSMGIDIAPGGVAAFPFRGSRIPDEVLANWIAPGFTPILQENMAPPISGTVTALLFNELPQAIISAAWQAAPFPPILQENLSPPISGPVAIPFFTGLSQAILSAWQRAPFAPILQENLSPPQSAPQNPPFVGGARVPVEVQLAWIPPVPLPITIDNLVPPIAGPTPQNPPFMGGAEVPAAVLISWQPIAPAPITGAVLPPQPATVVPPARLSLEILSSWQNAPWPIISGEQLTPPSGPQPSPLVGSRVQQEILNSWRLADFGQIVADNIAPTLPVVAASNPPFMGALVPLMVPDELAPIVARNLSPPISGPVTSNPPFAGGSRISREILAGWLPLAPAPIVGPKYTTGALPPLTPPFVGGARVPLEVQIGWLSPAPMPIVGPKYTPGGPAPTNPPFVGSRLTVEIQVNWIAPATLPALPVSVAPLLPPSVVQQPPFVALSQAILASWVPDVRPIIVAAKATPPSGPTNPPLIGSRVSIEILANWLPVAFAPITGPDLTPPSGPVFVPLIGARIPVEILASWQPASIYPLVADNLTPPSGPTFPLIGSNIPAATFAWHAAPPSMQPPQPVVTPSGPVAFPFTGSAVPSAIFAWHGIALQPQIPRPLPPIAQAFYPFVGTAVPREILQSWEFVAQPIYRRAQVTISGPIASQPPIGGGSIIRLSVLVNWIPPPPMPALPRASVVMSLPPTSIVFPQASLKGFETPTNLSGVEPTPSLKGTKNDPSLKGD